MTFLEAKKVLAALGNVKRLHFLMAMSGNPDQLELYLRAHAARAGFDAQVESLAFGTLGQHLFSEEASTEVFLLLPWDLSPECDWRSGMTSTLADVELILLRAEEVAASLKLRKAHLAYLPAPIPPICAASSDNLRLATELTALAVRTGAVLIPAQRFSLTSYLASGSPVAGDALSEVAKVLIDLLFVLPSVTFKVLATDADNTLWSGLVGEDGVGAVSADPHGPGFRHFIYQGFLRRLKAAGILLAVVSRNDEDVVRAVLESGSMPLRTTDFVAIRAGYGPKSEHLRELAESLNLGTGSVVFIDDNPVELAEVASSIPGITCQVFPDADDGIPGFLEKLTSLFNRTNLTAEDSERTEFYLRRESMHPPTVGQGLLDFLKNLEMVLTIQDRTNGDLTRACQLINKTNQFNLNGRRLDESQVAKVLSEGGRLITASLDDRSGKHGEILACLIHRDGSVRSLVMSCRVLQRRVEYAFLLWLLSHWDGPTLSFLYVATERNGPFQIFFDDPAIAGSSECRTINVSPFTAAHSAALSLFVIRKI